MLLCPPQETSQPHQPQVDPEDTSQDQKLLNTTHLMVHIYTKYMTRAML